MTEQPTTPLEPTPARPMPTLGRGGSWSAHPSLDGPVPPAEPYQPKPRTRPAGGWARTGSAGASTHLTDDEQPVTVRARAYDDEPPTVDVTKPGFGIVSIAEARSWGIKIPPAVELLAMADDLNAHGGLDEQFVAALLQAAAGGSETGGNAPAERPSFTEMIDKACDDALRVPPPGPIVVHPDHYDTFKTLMTPRPTPITYDEIVGLFAGMLPPPLPFDTIKLTQAQIDLFPATRLTAPSSEPWQFFGTPVELVETIEESTPYQLTVKPSRIVDMYTGLSEEKFEQLRSAWLRNLDAGPRPMRVVGEGPPFRGYLREIVAPPEHQHIWSATSPMRCVECRRYLRPWWRRTLDRVRRWGR